MPNYSGHLVGGVAVFALCFFLLPHESVGVLTVAEWLIATLLGSLFPDVDTKSKGHKIFYTLLLMAMLYFFIQRRFQAFVLCACLGLFPALVRHRGIFHDPWFIVVISIGAAFMGASSFTGYRTTIYNDAFFFCMGALFHVILDVGLRRFIKKLVSY